MTRIFIIPTAVALLCSLAAIANAQDAPATPEDIDAGRAIFAETGEPTCSVCHTLTDAEAIGEVGPNLDDFKPTFEQVRAAVTSGIGVMPAYEETLTATEIETVAKYVSEVTGGTKASASTNGILTENKDEKS